MFDRPVTFPTYMVSGSDRDDVRVAALTNPQSMPDQLETMLWRFLAGTTVPAPVPRPEPPYDGTDASALVGRNPGSTACPGCAGWEF